MKKEFVQPELELLRLRVEDEVANVLTVDTSFTLDEDELPIIPARYN